MGLGSLVKSVAKSAGNLLNDVTGVNSSASANRKWQEKMSNTAHQREVADLKKAGINPLFTATGGSGASTPSGSTGVSSGGFLGDIVNSAVNSAKANRMADLEERSLEQQLQKQTADIDNETRDSKEYQKTQEAQRSLMKAEEDEARSRVALNNNQWNENSATSKDRVDALNATNKKTVGDAEFEDSNAYRWNQVVSNSAESYASAIRDVGVGIAAARGIPGNYSKTSYDYDGKGRLTRYSEERKTRR